MKEKKTYTCIGCGEEQEIKEYYRSNSPLYEDIGHLPTCITCLVKVYNTYLDKYNDKYADEDNNNLKMALYAMCRMLNLLFDNTLFMGVKKLSEKKGTNILQLYLSKLSSLPQYRGKTFDDSVFLDEKDDIDINNFISNDEEDEEEIIVTKAMINKWGRSLKPEDYKFLEGVYESLIAIYDHKTPIQIMLYEDIARTRLAAQSALRSSNMQIYDKMMSTLSKIMQDASIKPAQENAANSEGLSTWGQWIKKIEETEPIPEATEEFKDVDGIMKYIFRWFTKHFYKILGVDNGDEFDIDESLEEKIDIIEEEDVGADIEDIVINNKKENKKKKGRGKNGK